MSTSDVSTTVPDSSPEQRFLDYVRTGDKAIIQGLIREFADRSYNQARRILGRGDGAEDAVQDAYIKLVQSAQRYDGSVPFGAWLGRLVTLSSLNHRERRMRKKYISNMDVPGVAAMTTSSGIDNTVDDADLKALREALDSLPDRYRLPLTLHYLGGLNRAEAASALDVPTKTLSKRIERGIEQLRAIMGRAGVAVTSAGLLATIANIPTYAAPPDLIARLTSTQRLVSAGERINEGLMSAKTAYLVKTSAIITAAVTGVATVIIAAVIMSGHPPAAGVTSDFSRDLLAHWTFDEGHGALVADASGNGHDGVAENGPTWVQGKIGSALRFDGLDDFVSVPNMESFETGRDQITVMAWIFMRNLDNPPQQIIGRRQGPGWGDLWGIFTTPRDGWQSIGFDISRKNVELGFHTTDLNTWVHLAAAYNGTELSFYLNSVLISSSPCTGKIENESSPLMLGAGENGNSKYGVYDEFLRGDLDEVRIYGRGLRPEEISAIYQHHSD